MTPRPEYLLGFADLVILAMVILLALHSVLRGKYSPLAPETGRSIIVAGVLLMAVIQLAELLGPTPWRGVGAIIHESHRLEGWPYWVLSRASILMIAAGLLLASLQRREVEQVARASTAKVAAARERATVSEERFRGLFETSPNALSCWTFDPPMRTSLPMHEQVERAAEAVLTECNDAFAQDIGFTEAADVIGMPMGDLDSVRDQDAHRKFMTTLIENNYRLTNYDLVFKSSAGQERAINLSATGIVEDGRLHRFWAAATNTLATRLTQNALYRRRIFQEILAAVSSRLVMARPKDADGVMLASMQEVCEFIGGNRMTLSWVDVEAKAAEVLYTWHQSDGPMADRIDTEQFPYLAQKLLDGESIVVPDIDGLPAEAAKDADVLRTFGMKSFLFFPMLVENQIVGCLTMGNDEQYRDWSDQDLTDLRMFGDLFANFVLRLRQRRVLNDALAGLQEATERLEAENVYLRSEIKVNHDFDDIIGESDALRRSLHMVERVADTTTPVLILGETGTGKELIARALHEHSRRRDRPLVKVNCAALPASLIESELFGYEKGAFTGAEAAKRGRFDLADGSTLFLDEIGEIPLELQAKLLRVLQEGEYERLGATRTVRVDVRIIAATNRDLWQACEEGEFRSDLYYRINTFPIEMPPLRERGGDIRLLAEHFAQQHAQRLGRNVTAISARMMEQLEAYDWPGNVRELEGVIQRALISTTGPVLELSQPLVDRQEAERASNRNLRSVEREHIIDVLKKTHWKISGDRGAAAVLAIPPSTLRSKMKKLGISRPA